MVCYCLIMIRLVFATNTYDEKNISISLEDFPMVTKHNYNSLMSFLHDLSFLTVNIFLVVADSSE